MQLGSPLQEVESGQGGFISSLPSLHASKPAQYGAGGQSEELHQDSTKTLVWRRKKPDLDLPGQFHTAIVYLGGRITNQKWFRLS